MDFRPPGEPPPRIRHRRHASLSRVTLGPATLDELRAREDLELRATRMLGEWLRVRAATLEVPMVSPVATTAPGDASASAAPVAATQPSANGPCDQESHAEVPLPPSDDEEMDLSISRKRARENESEDDEPAGPRKHPPSVPSRSEQPTADDDQDSAISRHPGETPATLSLPHVQIGAPSEPAESEQTAPPAESSSAISRHPAELAAASFEPPPSEGAPDSPLDAPTAPNGDARPAASSASAPAADECSTDAMELTHEAPASASQQKPEHPAARFLRGPPRQPASRPKRKGKKNKRRREPVAGSPPSRDNSDESRHSPAPPASHSVPAPAVRGEMPPARETATDGFILVQSRGDRRRSKALETAALPVDPARCRPCAVRVNHRRNIVAADTTTQQCLEGLLKLSELHAIPVTARLPAERGKSTGFLHGVSGLPADTELLGPIESDVPVLSATLDGSTVTIRFAGPSKASEAPPSTVQAVRPLRTRPGILPVAERLHLLQQKTCSKRLLRDHPLQELRGPPQGGHSCLPQMAGREEGGHNPRFLHHGTLEASCEGSRTGGEAAGVANTGTLICQCTERPQPHSNTSSTSPPYDPPPGDAGPCYHTWPAYRGSAGSEPATYHASSEHHATS
nr:nascent polypeptide-associated complex subunit alpha, muscle-specific form-like [Dermacentor andersoni]